MRKLLIKLIKLYQATPLRMHSYCRHIPRCSEYSIIAIERFGVFKGGYLSIKRIIKCNPWGTKGIDLVPERKCK